MDIYIDDEEFNNKKKLLKKDTNKNNDFKNKKKNNEDTDITFEIIKILTYSKSPSKFTEIVDKLTPYLEDNPKDILMNKIMAYSLMENGFYRDAERYFQKVLQINRNDIESMNGMAYLEIVNGNIQSAINYILDALYIDKDNLKLKKNLDLLKDIKDVKLFISKVRPSDFIFIDLPKLDIYKIINLKLREILFSPIIKALFIIIIVSIIIYFLYKLSPLISNWAQNYRFRYNIGRNILLEYSIKDLDQIIIERNRYKVSLTPEEVKQKFNMVKNYIYEKKYNYAVIQINEILNSDASEYVKEQVMFLQEFLPDVTVDNLDFNPNCRDILKFPGLYKNVVVRWNGMVVNLLRNGDRETSFDLLINFVNDAVVDGIAYVHFKGNLNIKNGDRIIIFGKVIGLTDNNKIVVQGINFQKIGK